MTSISFSYPDGGLSPSEVAEVLSWRVSSSVQSSTVGVPGAEFVDPDYNEANRYSLGPDTPEWFQDRLAQVVGSANSQIWALDLEGLNPNFLMLNYVAPAGKYNWHTDSGIGEHALRKLSVVVQLSRSNEYSGGDLEFFSGSAQWQASRQVGTIHVFPSVLVHRVSMVTSGQRWCLVTWAVGPPLR